MIQELACRWLERRYGVVYTLPKTATWLELWLFGKYGHRIRNRAVEAMYGY